MCPQAAKLQAARKQAQERAAAEAERVAQQLRSLGPTTQFSTPPFLHPMLYEHLQLGECHGHVLEPLATHCCEPQPCAGAPSTVD